MPRQNVIPYPDPPLEDGTVRLRRWARRDLDCIRAAAADPRIPAGTTVPALFSEAQGTAFVERQWGRQKTGEGLSLAIEDMEIDKAVGLIALLFRSEASVVGLGFWVIPEARGNHYAARAISLLSPWALGLGSIRRVEALVVPGNLASMRSLEMSSFQREGLLRSYLNGRQDVLMYSLLLADLEEHREHQGRVADEPLAGDR